jgi:hypothetical protein
MKSSVLCNCFRQLFNEMITAEEISNRGNTVAHVISRRLPTAEAGFETKSNHVGYMVNKTVLVQVLLRSLHFLLPLGALAAPDPISSIIRG